MSAKIKIPEDVLGVLAKLEYPTPSSARIAVRLDRESYLSVGKVLASLGGAWDRRSKAHVFGNGVDARSLVEGATNSGVVSRKSEDQEFGHFPTPDFLARQLVSLAGVERGDRVLEPSAGDGAIVLALQDAGAVVVAVERHPGRRETLLRSVLKSRDSLAQEDDFLRYRPVPRLFSRVVMNPPFLCCGDGDHLDHVRYAYSLLEPGGRLVAVMPASVSFRTDRRHAAFRAWYLGVGSADALPDGSFRESGTDVRVVVLSLVAS